VALTRRDPPKAPDRPELHDADLGAGALEELSLSAVRLRGEHRGRLCVQRLRVEESELDGVALAAGDLSGLLLSDVVLRDCDLSNLHSHHGSIRRTEIRGSRLVGFTFTEGRLQDLHAFDTTMAYASLAYCQLKRVVFERVILRDASFLGARLQSVAFVACDLAGADFRGASLQACTMRESSLEGVIGVDSLRGLEMPWSDVVASAGALAAALGIAVEPEP
jgi:uncharacterized protein YjbI with pentapeptide repeats